MRMKYITTCIYTYIPLRMRWIGRRASTRSSKLHGHVESIREYFRILVPTEMGKKWHHSKLLWHAGHSGSRLTSCLRSGIKGKTPNRTISRARNTKVAGGVTETVFYKDRPTCHHINTPSPKFDKAISRKQAGLADHKPCYSEFLRFRGCVQTTLAW